MPRYRIVQLDSLHAETSLIPIDTPRITENATHRIVQLNSPLVPGLPMDSEVPRSRPEAKPFRLMDLPRELRDLVYERAKQDVTVTIAITEYWKGVDQSWHGEVINKDELEDFTNLRCSCRQVHKETADLKTEIPIVLETRRPAVDASLFSRLRGQAPATRLPRLVQNLRHLHVKAAFLFSCIGQDHRALQSLNTLTCRFELRQDTASVNKWEIDDHSWTVHHEDAIPQDLRACLDEMKKKAADFLDRWLKAACRASNVALSTTMDILTEYQRRTVFAQHHVQTNRVWITEGPGGWHSIETNGGYAVALQPQLSNRAYKNFISGKLTGGASSINIDAPSQDEEDFNELWRLRADRDDLRGWPWNEIG